MIHGVVIGMMAAGGAGTDATGAIALSAQQSAAPDARSPALEMREYAGPGTVLRYGIYVPDGSAAPLPLVVMLHGCLQDASDFAAGTRMAELAREHGFIVVFPERSEADHPQKCWNWFDPEHQQRGSGEPALVAGLTRQVVESLPVDAGRVYLAGISAGGAMAAIVAHRYPELFEAVGIHSGIPFGAAMGVQAALEVMAGSDPEAGSRARAAAAEVAGAEALPRLIVIQGGADAVVAAGNAEHLVAQWSELARRGGRAPGPPRFETGETEAGFHWERASWGAGTGEGALIERLEVRELDHAWSGGSAAGSYTMPGAPDASREMLRFFAIIRPGVVAGGDR
jgi:poly(hydroxyalkanoate) depolymerase family esterase